MAEAAFAGVPENARGHFYLCFYGAVLQFLDVLRRLEGDGGPEYDRLLEQHPFLKGYLLEIQRHLPPRVGWSETGSWWRQSLAEWEERVVAHLPLRVLRRHAGLKPEAMTALMLMGAVEEDSRFGGLYATLQQSGQRRPTLDLVGRAAGGTDAFAVCRPLLVSGLAAPVDETVPRAEWELAVPAQLWDLMRGDPHPSVRPAAALPAVGDLLLPAPLREQVAHLPGMVQSGAVRAVIIRGMNGSGRLEVLGALARALGLGLLESDGSAGDQAARLGMVASLAGAMPVVRFDPSPGETAQIPEWKGYTGPVGIIIGNAGGVAVPQSAPAVTISLPPTDQESRVRCWQEAMGSHLPADVLERIVRYQMPPGTIRRVAATALTLAALDQREAVSHGDVRAACRLLGREALETLAVRLEPWGSLADLMVAKLTQERMAELELRCRFRESLAAQLPPAYDSGGGRGVRALFTGPSGTGKTLAARLLASTLGMELFRVDLSSVVNKYIGETEKNLNRLFARAEELDVILLLDEGDSLLARRSDVRSANDRYANLETNYLLQRLEAYQGIVLVTTNAADLIDGAFQRRMDMIVPFTAPGPAERYRIWQAHLPAAHQVEPAFLQEVAMRCNLSGGQIKNAALLAGLHALERQGPVTRRELEEAVASEYRKVGGLSPLRVQSDREGSE